MPLFLRFILVSFLLSILIGCADNQQDVVLTDEMFESISTDWTQPLADVVKLVGSRGRTLSVAEIDAYAIDISFPIANPVSLGEHDGRTVMMLDRDGDLPTVTCWGDAQSYTYVVTVAGTVMAKGRGIR